MAEDIRNCKACRKEFNISKQEDNKSLFKGLVSRVGKGKESVKKDSTLYCPECIIEDTSSQIRQ
ncbi:hypothetical protein [Alkaliphilus peptidifermentans]|uniref:Uncharacterized protein n=1 Tax=Alkaliphilus peptidifermentans DSM 18978 TaxID=1120976 RepID=A0A1G5AE91_9FIRM|nr:hypothetical protein [Alkaliphilus peptidifermentans]SCX76190.1 hypothetical protein SAMN03080606_00086 [Alkaliphilus peptidifermentans DSM 18978]